MLWFTSVQAPVTRRRQVIVTSPQVEAQLGTAAVAQLQQQGMRVLPTSSRAARRVQRIGAKLVHALAELDTTDDQATWLVCLSLVTICNV